MHQEKANRNSVYNGQNDMAVSKHSNDVSHFQTLKKSIFYKFALLRTVFCSFKYKNTND